MIFFLKFNFFTLQVVFFENCSLVVVGSSKGHFQRLERILDVLGCAAVFPLRLCNEPKIFCLRHFVLGIARHEAIHELHDISKKQKKIQN